MGACHSYPQLPGAMYRALIQDLGAVSRTRRQDRRSPKEHVKYTQSRGVSTARHGTALAAQTESWPWRGVLARRSAAPGRPQRLGGCSGLVAVLRGAHTLAYPLSGVTSGSFRPAHGYRVGASGRAPLFFLQCVLRGAVAGGWAAWCGRGRTPSGPSCYGKKRQHGRPDRPRLQTSMSEALRALISQALTIGECTTSGAVGAIEALVCRTVCIESLAESRIGPGEGAVVGLMQNTL